MIAADKNTFSARLMQKKQNDPTSSKDTFYAEFRICLALQGEAVWEIEDQTHSIRAGDIVFLNIGQRRQFKAFSQEGFQLAIFTLTRNAFAEPHHFTFFLERVKSRQNVLRSRTLAPLLQAVYEEWNGDRPFRYELISAKLTEFFIHAEREAGYTCSLGKCDLEMLALMDEIDAAVTSGISLQSAAQKARMSESTFSRRFSAVNGISFKQYVVEKKIQRAILLLKTTNLKMIDVAMESGFDSVSGFYDAFKKKTGTTPNKFLRFE